MAAVEPIRAGVEVPERSGVVARQIARTFSNADQWDVLLVLGFIMLTSGAGLVSGALFGVVVGVGCALGIGGSLFMAGGLCGARGITSSSEVIES